jgi:DNA polymerase-3 subunit alpha
VIDEQTIRFGLYSVKNFGEGIGDAIIAERERGGKFVSIADFLSRVGDKNLNKKSLEALIMSGSLDDLGERYTMLTHIEKLLEYRKELQSAPQGLTSLFGATEVSRQAELKLPTERPATQDEKLGWEKELLGFYVSGHPLDKHRDVLAKQKMNIKQMKESFPRGLEVVVGGFLETTNQILTKKGEKMIFGKLSDYVGSTEIVVFPKTLTEYPTIFVPGKCIAVKGKFSERNGEASFVVEKAKAL